MPSFFHRTPAYLALRDGTIYEGWAFGAPGTVQGEVVFNTSMSGYQEILTDPSYKGQIITFTYPMIGNYGINADDMESSGIRAEGLIVKELCRHPSNYRAGQTLDEWLAKAGVVGIEGLDTRALTRKLRSTGVMEGVLHAGEISREELMAKVDAVPSMEGLDLASAVTLPEARHWPFVECGSAATEGNFSPLPPSVQEGGSAKKFRVVAFDYGIKFNILRSLQRIGCEVEVVPSKTSFEEVMERKADGVFLSNGPGDPAAVDYTLPVIRRLVEKLPTFGICLGHQLVGLALGARTYKLKFGHRGANHPVMDLGTGVIEITSQNHGFAVDEKSLSKTGLAVSHLNLNDRTVEGLRHQDLPLFTVQYHPEASPGPHDAHYLFGRFREMLEGVSWGR